MLGPVGPAGSLTIGTDIDHVACAVSVIIHVWETQHFNKYTSVLTASNDSNEGSQINGYSVAP